MTATTELRVEMDDALRQRPDLLHAAEAASEFLDDFVRQHADTFGGDRAMAWRYQALHPDGERVVVTYSECDDLGVRKVQHRLSPKDLLDAMSRRNQMRELLQGVIAQRWTQMDAASAARRDSPAEEE